MPEFINVADLINPDTGNTYRQDNLALKHSIPVGSLVEINYQPYHGFPDDPEDHIEDGVRLHVTEHTRDCDGTPLYSLGVVSEDKTRSAFYGYGEELLSVIKEPDATIIRAIEEDRQKKWSDNSL